MVTYRTTKQVIELFSENDSAKKDDYYKLSNEELIRIYKLSNDMKARECLLLKNKNLVKKAAYIRKTYSSLEYDDLVQEGMIGLIYGIEKYDIKYETQFTTYAYYWIVQVIDRAIYDKGSLVRLPVHLIEKMNKLSKLEGQRAVLDGRVTPDEICRNLNISISEYNLLKFYIQNFKSIASLNKAVGEEGGDSDSELIDFIPSSSKLSDPSPSEDETEDTVMRNELRKDIDDLLSTLSPREEKILRLRFGLDDGRDRTLEEVGKEFNVTRERIRQIEARALRKLRHPSRSKKLRDYYE
jgi:RNA polymerase primary sigma factor